MTYEEFCAKFGLGPKRNSSRDRVRALLAAGLLRRVHGTQLVKGKLHRASFYLPAEPKASHA